MGPGWVEHPTSGLSDLRSNHLSYDPLNVPILYKFYLNLLILSISLASWKDIRDIVYGLWFSTYLLMPAILCKCFIRFVNFISTYLKDCYDWYQLFWYWNCSILLCGCFEQVIRTFKVIALFLYSAFLEKLNKEIMLLLFWRLL